MNKNSSHGEGGPCGACKFLRRKCINGCIFAPYFDSEQGPSHFAAVHKVFGASNVSKLLLRLPVHKRHEAVLSICYEALARIKDPVYGCVSHIFALQEQVVSLQAELAYLQAHLSVLKLPPQPMSPTQSPASASFLASSNLVPTSTMSSTTFSDPLQLQQTFETASYGYQADQQPNNSDFPALAREFVSRYLQEVRYRPSDSS